MNHWKKWLFSLVVGSLGIIYGDIGTSPLYALNEVFFWHAHFALTEKNIVGVSSLIFWIFVIIICIKYIVFVLRADNNGEGGPFALLNLLHTKKDKKFRFMSFLLLFATGLLFGEGIITPAISVLSAVEWLKVVAPSFDSWVVPVTVCILTLIFALQKFGSSTIWKVYGPIMLIWFFTIGALGTVQIAEHPSIIWYTLNPYEWYSLLSSLSFYSIALIMSSVFLVITWWEALYADMGHFWNKAIRISWFFIVFPALILNYMWQSAYLLSGKPIYYNNLFYSLSPSSFLIPLIILATAATFIASVALIFGIYSITAQAIAMHIIPRMTIHHTNKEIEGQIYIPFINWLLFLGSVSLVFAFGSASRLAAAYGLSVAWVMLTTSLALYFVATNAWWWKRLHAFFLFGIFICIDAAFVFANSIKFLEGGYIPIILGCIIFILSATWRWGKRVIRIARKDFTSSRNMKWLLELKQRTELSKGILKDKERRHFVETDRAVVFLVSRHVQTLKSYIPTWLRVYLKSRGSIPKNIIILTIEQIHLPFLQNADRYEIVDFGNDVYSVKVSFWFMEKPDIGTVLKNLYDKELFDDKFLRCTLEVSEDDFVLDPHVPWKYKMLVYIFKFLARNSLPRYTYFGLSSDATPGISKTIVPIHFNPQGVYIDIPEFAFEKDHQKKKTIDPKIVKFRDMWGA
jgi:KUP system potassium uptake protein